MIELIFKKVKNSEIMEIYNMEETIQKENFLQEYIVTPLQSTITLAFLITKSNPRLYTPQP